MDDRDFDLAGACRAADFYVQMLLILAKGSTSKYDKEIERARVRYRSLLFAVGVCYNLEYLHWTPQMVAEEAHKLDLEDFSVENAVSDFSSIYTFFFSIQKNSLFEFYTSEKIKKIHFFLNNKSNQKNPDPVILGKFLF